MPFEILRNDITNMQVDAIVNAASRLPRVGAGVDSAVHKKAGPALLAARKEVGCIQPGTAAVTPAFGLDAEYVIHAATPAWVDGEHGEMKLLRQTYEMCLNLAAEKRCDSIAFPLLAAGTHGFPKSKALQVAVAAFSEFLMEHEMQIYLVVFGKDSVRVSEKLFHKVSSFIDENYVDEYRQEVYGDGRAQSRRVRDQMRRSAAILNDWDGWDDCAADIRAPALWEKYSVRPTEVVCDSVPCKEASISLDEFIQKKDAGFTETLLELIKKSGKKNSVIYKKANISKQHFSKIINDPNSKPTKATAIALALALELDLEGTRDLIGRAGYALTNSSTFDLIIQYFIVHKQFNVIEINIALYEFDQSLLGA